MKVLRKIIQIDEDLCDGCGNCVIACAEGAIKIVDGKARVIADKYCDGLGACIGDCPEGALTIVEREADDFDEKAVEELLKQKASESPKKESATCGCPSSVLKTFSSAHDACACVNHPTVQEAQGRSFLGHWPVQIRLIPPGAPFLKNADVVIAADCVPVAYPCFHSDFLKGRAVMIGCPKFDNPDEYVEKLAQVFKVSAIKSITVVIMEVPCCSALPMIVKKALAGAGVDIPTREVVISPQGAILP